VIVEGPQIHQSMCFQETFFIAETDGISTFMTFYTRPF